jgi:hypothetical protein
MACRFHEAEVALEWWRAGNDRSLLRLESLVEHWMNVNAVIDAETRKATYADALANRYTWEL